MRYIVQKFLNCRRCSFAQYRNSIVFGRGELPADLLLIGEAPGKTEDWGGVPFIGQAGKLLGEAIHLAASMAGIENPPSYFITNVCSCRPTNEKNGENRPPTDKEASHCQERLRITFDDVRPRKVVFLGQVAERQCRRLWPNGASLTHPAYILRKGGTESPEFITFSRKLADIFKELTK